MLGLILKDLKNVAGQAIYYLAILAILYVVAFLTKNVYFYAGAVVFFSISVPVSAIAYDEKDVWDAFALAAGMRRRDLVLSRYLLCLFVALFLFLLSVAFCAVEEMRTQETLAVFLAYGGITFLVSDFLLPFVLKVGTEKARAAFTVMIVCVLALGGGVAVLTQSLPGGALLASCILLALGVFGGVVSYYVALRLYSAKVF